MSKLFSKFLTSNGMIDYFNNCYDSNEVVLDFGEEFYTYFKIFDISGQMDVYINDNPNKIKIPNFSDSYEFVIENLQIQKVRIVITTANKVTQQQIDAGRFSANDLGKYNGVGTLQYFVAK